MSTGSNETITETPTTDAAPPDAVLPAADATPLITSTAPTATEAADAASTKPTKKLLTKKDLINRLTTASRLTKRQINSVLDTLRDTLIAELKTNGVVTLPGLLKFKIVEQKARPERRSINPSTHQPMTVPAKPVQKALRSSPFKVLKDAVLKD